MSFLSFGILEKILLTVEFRVPLDSPNLNEEGRGHLKLNILILKKWRKAADCKIMFSFFFHVCGRSRKSTIILVDGRGHSAECL